MEYTSGVSKAQKVFKTYPTLVRVDIPADEHFTICGDIHGQYYDLLNIFELNGLPSERNPYLFNGSILFKSSFMNLLEGDFVDRGSFSVEVILTLLAFKCLYPDHMHLTRGNHETTSMNKIYGFEGEASRKVQRIKLIACRSNINIVP